MTLRVIDRQQERDSRVSNDARVTGGSQHPQVKVDSKAAAGYFGIRARRLPQYLRSVFIHAPFSVRCGGRLTGGVWRSFDNLLARTV
jgi:hypothetical protein